MLDTTISHGFEATGCLSPGIMSGWPIHGFAEDTDSPLAAGPLAGGDSPASAPLAALAGSALARRFCAWNGVSGERYICSVFPLETCPAFADAVILAVSADMFGSRKIVAAADTGPMPELLTQGALLDFVRGRGANEWHVHLLCNSLAARQAMVEDLAQGR